MRLVLKWGTVEGGTLLSERAWDLMQVLYPRGLPSGGAMTDTLDDKRREILCSIIDEVAAEGGMIYNDGTGEVMEPSEAKTYVRKYNKREIRRVP